MLEVIGASFGRTGTHSLAAALEKLGFGPCYTLLDVDKNPDHIDRWNDAIEGRRVDWGALYQGYRSAVEWPTVAFLASIVEQFPEAEVILTLRDPESWYESTRATIFPGLEVTTQHPDPEQRARSRVKRRLILEETFAGRYRDKAYAIAVYQTHIDTVIQLVPPNRLLRYRIRDGWEPLCRFLGAPEPDEPFPRRNQRAEFLASAPEWAKRLMEAEEEREEPTGGLGDEGRDP
ncbi:MAG: sulfotransferase [Anaerolineales bacterium]|jgi:hypothetical protein